MEIMKASDGGVIARKEISATFSEESEPTQKEIVFSASNSAPGGLKLRLRLPTSTIKQKLLQLQSSQDDEEKVNVVVVDVYRSTETLGGQTDPLVEQFSAPAVQQIPTEFSISAFPNPFNPATTFRIVLPNAANVSLRVYNLLGQEVARLLDGEIEAAEHSIPFGGSHLVSGVYFYRLVLDGEARSGRLLLLK